MFTTPFSLASVLALWLLTGPVVAVLGQVTTPSAGTPTGSAPASTSTYMSPSIRRPKPGELSENAKVGISVGVTLSSIILVGTLAILCVVWRRRRALSRPETRLSGDVEDDDIAMNDGDNYGKGKDVSNMNPATAMAAANYGAPIQASDGFVSEGNGYPNTPAQAYIPQQYPQTMTYPTAQSGAAYGYSNTIDSGATMTDPNQQNGYTGLSSMQYRIDPHAHMQQRQQQQQQIYSSPAIIGQNQQSGYAASSIPQHYQLEIHSQFPNQSPLSPQQGYPTNWAHPTTSTLPEVATPMQDFQFMFLQDYQQSLQDPSIGRSTSLRQYQDGGPDQIITSQVQQDGTGASYYVPPPRPNASELPDQRKPVELVGEGHYTEAP